MKRLLSFEFTKIWRTNKTLVTLALLILALVGMVRFFSAQDAGYWTTQVREIENERVRIDNLITSLEDKLELTKLNSPEDTEAIGEIEADLEFIHRQRRYNYEQKIHAEFYNTDKAKRLELWINRDTHLLAGLEAGHSFLDETPANVRQRLAVNQYLSDNNIEPLNSPYEMNGTNYLYHLTDYPWILLVLVAISLLCIDMFSGDSDGGAFKFLYSQPFRRKKIHGAKFLVYFGNSFLMVTAVVILGFVVVYLLNGLGHTDYPAFYNSVSFHSLTAGPGAADALNFLPWSGYIVRVIPLYILMCCFITVFIGTASLILNNTANTLSALFCLLYLDYSVRNLFQAPSKFYIFWPFTAAGINSILRGMYFLSASAYLILLSVMTAALLATSLAILNKRDMTGGMGL